MKKWWNNLSPDAKWHVSIVVLVIEIIALLAMFPLIRDCIEVWQYSKACKTLHEVAGETFQENEIVVYTGFSDKLMIFNVDTLEIEEKNVSDNVEYVEALKKVAYIDEDELSLYDVDYFVYKVESTLFTWGYADSYEEVVEKVEEYLKSYKCELTENCVVTEMVVTPVQ